MVEALRRMDEIKEWEKVWGQGLWLEFSFPYNLSLTLLPVPSTCVFCQNLLLFSPIPMLASICHRRGLLFNQILGKKNQVLILALRFLVTWFIFWLVFQNFYPLWLQIHTFLTCNSRYQSGIHQKTDEKFKRVSEKKKKKFNKGAIVSGDGRVKETDKEGWSRKLLLLLNLKGQRKWWLVEDGENCSCKRRSRVTNYPWEKNIATATLLLSREVCSSKFPDLSLFPPSISCQYQRGSQRVREPRWCL